MTVKNTMSVTRALAELKRLEDRIGNAIREGQFVGVVVGKGTFARAAGSQPNVDAVSSKIQASFDKVESLISLRQRIKSAIILSNAKTLVTIGGKQMTVAEAIEYKSFIATKVQFLNQLRTSFGVASNAVAKLNSELDAIINRNLETVYGNEKGKADVAMVEAISKPQREQKEASLLDPQDIARKIDKLSEEISVVQSEIDFVLSESNARTDIEV